MRYYLDTEFDGHNGPLLSLALVAESGPSLHLRTGIRAMDLWVIHNVEPVMDAHDADIFGTLDKPNNMGRAIRDFLRGDDAPVIVADSAVDIGRFCAALTTGEDGGWASFDGNLTFEVQDVPCYPTSLSGAVQHNAWWDAMALREKVRSDQTLAKTTE